MDFEFAYVLWFILTIASCSIAYNWGFKDGKREGIVRGKILARKSVNS